MSANKYFTGIDEGEVRVSTAWDTLNVTLDGGSSWVDLSYETAHALADWIIANVPKPEPKTAWDRWVDLAIGATFRVDGGGEYRKISEMQMVHLPVDESEDPYHAEEMRRIWGGYGYDLIEEFSIPLPTNFGAVVKSGGLLYTRSNTSTDTYFHWTSMNGNLATDGTIKQQGFEVIFEGVED